MDSLNLDSLRCPTCRAEQPWSDTCRRCKSDLRLLREVAENYAAARKRCLVSLRQNRPAAALKEAKQAFALHAGAESHRLLAVCELLSGNWSQALGHAQTDRLTATRSTRSGARAGPDTNSVPPR